MWFRKLSMAAVLVSCSAVTAYAQAQQTVTFMALDVVNFRGALEQFIDEFEKKNPDVDIVPNFTPQLGAQFLSMLQANNLNDVTLLPSPRIVQYLSSGKLVPLPADVVATLRETLDPGSLEPVTRGEDVFAVPYNFYPNSGVVMYNEKLWKDAGIDPAQAATWADFMKLSQTLTKTDAKAPEDGATNETVVRLYEATGQQASAELRVHGARRAWQSDMRETKGSPIDCVDGVIALDFEPFEIKTIRLARDPD